MAQLLSHNRNRHARALILFAAVAPLLATTAAYAAPPPAGADALEFAEKIVAGGPDDAMTVRHLRFRGSNRAIGRKLAEIARERHGVQPIRMDPARAERRSAFYKKHYPIHDERARGAGELFGVRPSEGLDSSILPYSLPPSIGCSVVYYPPSFTQNGHAILSRNLDFSTGTWAGAKPTEGEPSTTEQPYVIEVYPDRGYPALYLCAYELLGGALDGINSEGLTVALLANEGAPGAKPTNRWQVGLSEIEIVRFLLDTCANVEEAKAALEAIEVYYCIIPCHYIIGDRHGKSFVWEYSYDLRRRYAIDAKSGPQCVTNHALHQYPTVADLPTAVRFESHERYRSLDRAIREGAPKISLDAIERANRNIFARALPAPPGNRTLWHSIYDSQDRSLRVDFYLGEPRSKGTEERRSGYLEFKLRSGSALADANPG